MRKIIFVLFGIAAIILFTNSANVSDIPEGIVYSIKTGNSKELAKYFNISVDVVVLDKEDVYSNQQAEQIIKNFFATHSPKNFTILHEGGKDGSKYAIGNLSTSNGIFRVYFLLKIKNNVSLIHQLRIETETNAQ
jgi:hypothetical protein